MIVNPSTSQRSTCYACLDKRWRLELVYKCWLNRFQKVVEGIFCSSMIYYQQHVQLCFPFQRFLLQYRLNLYRNLICHLSASSQKSRSPSFTFLSVVKYLTIGADKIQNFWHFRRLKVDPFVCFKLLKFVLLKCLVNIYIYQKCLLLFW